MTPGATIGSARAIMAGMATRRPWRTARLPRLVGIKGACALLGVHKTTLHLWIAAGSGDLGPDKTYMIPPVRIGDGGDVDDGWPVWVREDVERFAVEIGRQRAPVGESKGSYALRRAAKRQPDAIRREIEELQAQLAAAESSKP